MQLAMVEPARARAPARSSHSSAPSPPARRSCANHPCKSRAARALTRRLLAADVPTNGGEHPRPPSRVTASNGLGPPSIRARCESVERIAPVAAAAVPPPSPAGVVPCTSAPTLPASFAPAVESTTLNGPTAFDLGSAASLCATHADAGCARPLWPSSHAASLTAALASAATETSGAPTRACRETAGHAIALSDAAPAPAG